VEEAAPPVEPARRNRRTIVCVSLVLALAAGVAFFFFNPSATPTAVRRVPRYAAPGEVIAYSDDDIFYYPGWLEAQLEILDCFPQAGMVSGIAVRNAAGHARRSLDQLAAQGAPGLSIAHQRRIPDAWEADWALSTGRDPQAHLQATQEHLDLVFRLAKPGGGVCEAIGSADHFQFVTPRQVIRRLRPWTGSADGLDDRAGLPG
jgi:hypothetical protein